MKRRTNRNHYYRTTVGLCLGAMVGGTALLHTAPAKAGEEGANKLEKLEKENQDLKKRLDLLEAMAQKEGLMPSGSKGGDPPVSAFSDITLSGFVTTSYFHDSSMPKTAGLPGSKGKCVQPMS